MEASRSMSAPDQLLTLAEVSVALAGFAGVIATFQGRRGSRRSRGDALGLTTMVTMSLMVATMSAVPLAILNFGIAEPLVWSAASALFAAIYVIFLIYIRSRMISVKMKGANRLIILCWWAYNFLIVIALFSNIADSDSQRQYGKYFIALLNPLLFSGYMFVRLLLRPLWMEVHHNESQGTSAVGTKRQ